MMLLASILLAATTSAAGTNAPGECGDWPRKPAWEWTDQERLERRFDDQCMAARRLQAGHRSRPDGSCHSSGAVSDFVFGTDTPELFMPWQLFDTLLRNAIVAESKFAAMQRRRFEDRANAQELPLPGRFWERLEVATGEYVALLREQREMASRLDGASPAERRVLVGRVQELQRPNCAVRQLALSRVRAEFTASTFDQFLYSSVAPGICSSGDSALDMLEWVGRGCPGRN